MTFEQVIDYLKHRRQMHLSDGDAVRASTVQSCINGLRAAKKRKVSFVDSLGIETDKKPVFDPNKCPSGRTVGELKELIKAENLEIRKHGQALHELKEDCPHPLPKISKKQWDEEDGSISGYCPICGRDFGWRCPESPDGICHYHSDDGLIELIDGRSVPIPKDHNPDYETSDACIFCGDPDERK